MEIAKKITESRIFIIFLEDEKNNVIYSRYLNEPNQKNATELNETYKKFERQMIVRGYLKKTIEYEARRFDKKIRSAEKEKTSLDKVVYGTEIAISELLIDGKSTTAYETIYHEDLSQIFEDVRLAEGVANLTEKQREVLYMIYILELSEKEIAKRMNVTQQAISKVRKAAIKKMRETIK